jgi:Asp-tRNA(Asn)/Glu-tRNA(Gln) amidotransferase A subunit family amidase
MTPILSAAEISRRVRAKDIFATEVLEEHLRRVEKLNPQLHAITSLDAESAHRAARAVDARLATNEPLPLAGVPVTIKSSIDVAGLRCEAGSRLRAGNVPAADAPLVQRLKSAGAVVIGTTNTPEMLMAYETDNLLYGRTSNPCDVARSAGGSSGGEAAAIASGMSAGGVGSDGGGSIRVPAHFTGICGLKPTPGRVPGTGHYPECGGPWATLGVVGPMARNIADLRLLWQILAGPDDGDPMSAPVPLSESAVPLKGARIGLLEMPNWRATAETDAAVNSAARALEQAGAVVEPMAIDGWDEALRIWQVIFCYATAAAVAPMIRGREADVSPILHDFLRHGRQSPPLTVESLLRDLVLRDRVRARVLAQMRPYRALLAPVTSAPAFRHGEGGWGPSHPADYLRTMRPCQFGNAMGLPGAVAPVARSSEGLPIGVQIIGRPYEEDAVLAVAEIIEAAAGFAVAAAAAVDS